MSVPPPFEKQPDPSLHADMADALPPSMAPVAERRELLTRAAYDSLENRTQNPRYATDKDGSTCRAAEYPDVFSMQGELIDGPMTAVIIETGAEKALIKREDTEEGRTFSLATTGMALEAAQRGEPVRPLAIPESALHAMIVSPGSQVTFEDPKTGMRQPVQGIVTRITAMQLDEAGVVQASPSMLARLADRYTDARDAFNADIRYIRQHGVARNAGDMAVAQSVSTNTVAPRKERMAAAHEPRLKREQEMLDELVDTRLVQLSHALTDRLISSEGVTAQLSQLHADDKMRRGILNDGKDAVKYSGSFTSKQDKQDSFTATIYLYDDITSYSMLFSPNGKGEQHHMSWDIKQGDGESTAVSSKNVPEKIGDATTALSILLAKIKSTDTYDLEDLAKLTPSSKTSS